MILVHTLLLFSVINIVELFLSIYKIESRLNVKHGLRHLEELYRKRSFWSYKLSKWVHTETIA